VENEEEEEEQIPTSGLMGRRTVSISRGGRGQTVSP